MSLRIQEPPVDPARVFLFQDFAEKDPDLTLRCVEAFKQIFPGAVSFIADRNLGVALNYHRAELFVFEVLRSESAYFFEDDLLLGPNYLATLNQLAAFALADRRIAYASAYGDHRLTFQQQQAAAGTLSISSWKWGYVQTRLHWIQQREIMEGYLDIIRPRPYRSRDETAIRRYFDGLGYSSAGTSQDSAKDVASCVIGTCKINTRTCHARYIGRSGVHATESFFAAEGFERTTIFPERQILNAPSSEDLDRFVEQARGEGRLQQREYQLRQERSGSAANLARTAEKASEMQAKPAPSATMSGQVLSVRVSATPGLRIETLSHSAHDIVRLEATQRYLAKLFRFRSRAEIDFAFDFQIDDSPKDFVSVSWQRKADFTTVVLVPDLYHVEHDGYHGSLAEDLPQWSDRQARFFWRGASTGFDFTARTFDDLPRYRLCKIGRTFGDVADFSFYKVVQGRSEEDAAIVSARLKVEGLLRPFVGSDVIARNKFLVIIDGNANSWGSMERFGLGSCVLLVESPWQLWHNRHLRAWEHFVPVAADLSNLAELMEWCLSHDDQARDIAANGRRLALSLDFESEMREAADAVIARFGAPPA